MVAINPNINRFLLCKLASKATRLMHRPGQRVESTIQESLSQICTQKPLATRDNSVPRDS